MWRLSRKKHCGQLSMYILATSPGGGKQCHVQKWGGDPERLLELWRRVNSLGTDRDHKETWKYWVNGERRGIPFVLFQIFFVGINLLNNGHVTVNWSNSFTETPGVLADYNPYIVILFLTFFLMFIFEERERQSVSRGGAERQGDTESEAGSRLWAISTEPDKALELMSREIMTWAEVGHLKLDT